VWKGLVGEIVVEQAGHKRTAQGCQERRANALEVLV
jgi:hypothetical protein